MKLIRAIGPRVLDLFCFKALIHKKDIGDDNAGTFICHKKVAFTGGRRKIDFDSFQKREKILTIEK